MVSIYDMPSTCNKCGGPNNKLARDPFYEGCGETETKCRDCGFDDYWSYGHFESSCDGLNESAKYINDNGHIKIIGKADNKGECK